MNEEKIFLNPFIFSHELAALTLRFFSSNSFSF
jgi:hypothetical protein